MLAAEMDVASGGMHDKGRRCSLCVRFEALQNNTAYDLFDVVAVDRELWCRPGHRINSSQEAAASAGNAFCSERS